MSCGCAKKSNTSTAVQDRAVMCHVCERAEHDPINALRGAVACTISGRPMIEHAKGLACPLGRFPPDNRSLVFRWATVRWYGVPFPLRLWVRVTHRTHPRPSWWRGCGCVVVIKDLWNRLKYGRKTEVHHGVGTQR